MRSRHHHLAKRGTAGTYYVVLGVPKSLRPAFEGKHHLLRNLGTTDLAVALAKRTPALAELEALIAHAHEPEKIATIMEAASDLQRQYQRIARGDLAGMHFRRPSPASGWSDKDMALATLDEGIAQAADELAGRYGPGVATGFVGVATGIATPLMLHIDSWLAEGGTKGPLSEKAQKQYRSAVAKLEKWLIETGRPATVESVDRKTVGTYVSETMIAKDIDRVTGNSWISPCSSYWRWLMKRQGVETNPWQGAQFSKPVQRKAEKNKRGFTDAEMLKLLTGPADQFMHDTVRIAALSGMRRSEIANLRVQDCANGYFDIVESKTPAGIRRVHIHPALASIIARLTADRAADDYLLTVKAKNRGDRLGKVFNDYRQACGVVDKAQDRRQDRVDMHSARKWFSTKARNAGADKLTVDVVTGHEGDGLTDTTYHDGVDWVLQVKAVEGVRLPK